MIVSLKSEIASADALATGCRARWPLAVADSSKGGMVAEARGSRVFISYRREDCGYPARWLFDQLAASLGADRVFKDVDSIEPGDDFAEVISNPVLQSGVCDLVPPPATFALFDVRAIERAVGARASHVRWR